MAKIWNFGASSWIWSSVHDDVTFCRNSQKSHCAHNVWEKVKDVCVFMKQDEINLHGFMLINFLQGTSALNKYWSVCLVASGVLLSSFVQKNCVSSICFAGSQCANEQRALQGAAMSKRKFQSLQWKVFLSPVLTIIWERDVVSFL